MPPLPLPLSPLPQALPYARELPVMCSWPHRAPLPHEVNVGYGFPYAAAGDTAPDTTDSTKPTTAAGIAP
ncbi:hypothetical protein [Streptomyces sp. NPDC047108]|uniref:hypothetical protein n=1 Tax=Streptomyces sp. NPDC047108 TaxID=3155025 RepID=UPI0033DBD7BA